MQRMPLLSKRAKLTLLAPISIIVFAFYFQSSFLQKLRRTSSCGQDILFGGAAPDDHCADLWITITFELGRQ